MSVIKGDKMIDLSKMKIITDDSLVDADGEPRKDAEILPDNRIRCHPDMKEQVVEALKTFFNNQENEEDS